MRYSASVIAIAAACSLASPAMAHWDNPKWCDRMGLPWNGTDCLPNNGSSAAVGQGGQGGTMTAPAGTNGLGVTPLPLCSWIKPRYLDQAQSSDLCIEDGSGKVITSPGSGGRPPGQQPGQPMPLPGASSPPSGPPQVSLPPPGQCAASATPQEMRSFCTQAFAQGHLDPLNAGDCAGWFSVFTTGVLPSSAGDCGSKPVCPSATIPQGVYEANDTNSSSADARVSEFTGAGFTLEINYAANYAYSSIENMQSYGKLVSSHGGRVIWNMRDTPPAKATEIAKALAGNPGTYGYYVADEPEPGQSSIVSLNQAIKTGDPSHPTVAVLGWWSLRGGVCGSQKTNTSFLDKTADYADFLALDYYPSDPQGTGNIQSSQSSCEQADMPGILAAASGWAKAHGKRWGVVLQAFSMSAAYKGGRNPSTWPSQDQLTQWRDIALKTNPEWIIWYSYFDIKDHNPGYMKTLQAGAFAGGSCSASAK